MTLIKKTKQADNIYQKFKKEILEKRLNPGDRLPSERELQDELGISRGTIREAYRTLKQNGLVESRRGGGTYVKEIDIFSAGTTLFTLMQLQGISFEHVQEFRESVESRCAARAVEIATEDQIKHVRYLITQMTYSYQTNKDASAFYEQELNLHAELSRITQNPLFEWFTDVFGRHAAENSKTVLNNAANEIYDVIKDWNDFIDAMEQRRVILAMEIMAYHIVRFRRVLREAGKK